MSVFHNARNIFINGGTFAAHSHSSNRDISVDHAVELLVANVAVGALHNSGERFDPPKCHPETRQAVIQRIMDWLDDSKCSSSFMWIYGPAGVGKSAILQSLADLCFSRKRLAGSFFFGRTIARRNTKDFLITTIAYQMTICLPEIRDRVLKAIEIDPAIFSRSLEAQAEALIIQPINETVKEIEQGLYLRSRPASLVIVDGLDECILPESQAYILATLSRLAALLSARFLFVIASRPEKAIRKSFRENTLSSLTTVINLADFSKDVDKDIRVFLDSKFQSITHTHPARSSFPQPWPTQKQMDLLMDKTNGHFIYASTIMKYLESERASPVQRLTHILEKTIPQSDTPLAALDALYHYILSSVADVETVHKILAVVILSQNEQMKKTSSIEHLFALECGTAHIVFNDLHSVVHIPEEQEGNIRIYHVLGMCSDIPIIIL